MNLDQLSDLLSAKYIANVAFHLFMIFIAIYTGLIVWALTRFGRSKFLGLQATLGYVLVIMNLYLQAARIIATL